MSSQAQGSGLFGVFEQVRSPACQIPLLHVEPCRTVVEACLVMFHTQAYKGAP